ncbi:MAG: endonuclease/exonuclease/phosphatase family protein, partial [Desulfobacterales bacterium]
PHSGPDTARHLANRLQLTPAWAPSRHKSRLVAGYPRTCYSGLAILSRYPIRQHHRLTLPPHPKDPERIAQWVDITVDHHLWRVINIHLTHIREAAALRQKQLTETLAQVDRCGSPDTAWLCGDFNAAPNDPEMQFVLNRPGWNVADAYTEAGGILPGATFPVTNGPSGGRRIDRIFVLTRGKARRLRFQNAATVLMRPDSTGLFPSDHAGVMVDVDV